MIKKIISGSQFYIYSAYLPTLISFFTLPIITPYLTLRDYGLYGLFFSVYSFLAMLLNLGFSVEYQNSYFNQPDEYKSIWSRVLGFQIIWNLISIIPLLAILGVFSFKNFTLSEFLFISSSIALPYLFFDPLKLISSRHMQYNEKHRSLFIVTSIATVAQYMSILVFALYFKLGFLAWFFGSFVNSLISGVFFFVYLRKNQIQIIPNFSFKDLNNRIRKQSSIILSNLSGYILEVSDRVLLSFFNVPITDIGKYNVAYNYTNYGQTVNGAINTVFSPIYFKSVKEMDKEGKKEELEVLFRVWLSFVFLVSINMIIWADFLFKFLYRNESLSSTYNLAFPIIISLMYRPFYVMVVDNLIIHEKTRLIASISVFAAAFNFIFNLIFIPYFGIYAAIYTTAFAYLIAGFVGVFLPKIRNEMSGVFIKGSLFLLIFILILMALVNIIDFKSLIVKLVVLLISLILVIIYNWEYLRQHQKIMKLFRKNN